MSSYTDRPPDDPARLRTDAEGLLRQGMAPPARGGPVSVDALALLHRLASSPASAPDALKLLHELQVHQVELDLQHGQIMANESALVRGLACYRAFFESAPVGCVLVDLDGWVIEANPAFVQLLALGSVEVGGCALHTFVAPACRVELAALLESFRKGSVAGSCELAVADDASGARQPRLRVSASYAPEAAAVLMIVAPPDQAPGD